MEEIQTSNLAQAEEEEREEAEDWSRVMRRKRKDEFDHFHLVLKISRF